LKALVIHEHGGLEQLTLDPDFPDPVPGEGEVVLRVRACSLNYHDIFTRRGMPGITIPMPIVMGLDVAGEVHAVGPGVTGWRAGDRVVVDPYDQESGTLVGETVHGGLAELCKVHARQLIRLPAEVGFEAAAALPVAFGTAHRMIRTIGQVRAGERVLVLGASGGVGVASVLLSRLAGAEVVACVGSEEKKERLLALGASHCINYTQSDFAKEVHARFGKPQRFAYANGVNVVVNFTGGDTYVKSLKCLQRGGRLLTCGATAGFDPKTDLRYIWSFELQVRGSNGWERQDLLSLLDLVASGRLEVPIDHVFPLEQGAQAMAALEGRNVIGKVVVRP
jgi:alcohol dehydrogenase